MICQADLHNQLQGSWSYPSHTRTLPVWQLKSFGLFLQILFETQFKSLSHGGDNILGQPSPTLQHVTRPPKGRVLGHVRHKVQRLLGTKKLQAFVRQSVPWLPKSFSCFCCYWQLKSSTLWKYHNIRITIKCSPTTRCRSFSVNSGSTSLAPGIKAKQAFINQCLVRSVTQPIALSGEHERWFSRNLLSVFSMESHQEQFQPGAGTSTLWNYPSSISFANHWLPNAIFFCH